MADPTLTQTHDVNKDILLNADGSPITPEQRHIQDQFVIKDDTTPYAANNLEPARPTTIAGSDKFGLGAVPTPEQNQRIQDLVNARQDTPQFANDTETSTENAYVNNIGEAAIRQFNGAQSGSLGSGMIAGTIASELHEERLALQENEAREDRATYEMILNAWEQDFNDFMADFDDLEGDLNRADQNLAETTVVANEQLDALQTKIDELNDLKLQQEKELKDLSDRAKQAKTPEEQAFANSELELKKAELENTTANLNFATGSYKGLSTALGKATTDQADAKRQMDDLKSQISSAESSGDKEKLASLKAQLSDAQNNFNKAQSSIDDLNKKVEAASLALKAANSAHLQSTTCSATPELTSEKAAKINAATKVVNAMSAATLATSDNGSGLSRSEISNIVALAKVAKIDQSQFEELTRKAADAGMIMSDDGTTRLSADQASEMLNAEWTDLNTELEQTSQQLNETTAQANQVTAALEQDKATVAQATNVIAEKTTTGSLESQASAKIGVAVIGDNMSRITNVIKDVDGNEVYADRSGAEETYFYLNKDTGQRVDYKADDLQVLNFKMGKDGNAPMSSAAPMSSNMSSSSAISSILQSSSAKTSIPEPVKVFANDKVDNETYLAKFQQVEGQKSVQTNEQKLASLTSDINSLQQKGSMIASDMQAIEKIQAAKNSGSITEDEAINQLTQVKNNVDKRVAASSTTSTQTSAASSGTRTASETLALNVPEYTPDQQVELKRKIDNITAITAEGVQKLKEEAAKVGISPDTIDDTLKAHNVEIKENDYAQTEPEVSTPTSSPTRSVNFSMIGVTTQTPIIASYAAPKSDNNVLGGGYQSFADSPAFAATNAKNAGDSPTFKSIQIANPIEATGNFGTALDRPDPAVAAAEAANAKLAQEAALRQAQELLAARAASPTSGSGMMGGGASA